MPKKKKRANVDGKGGQAESTKSNVRIVKQHLNNSSFWRDNTPTAQLTVPWSELSPEVLSRNVQAIVKDFANYLLNIYMIPRTGLPYAKGTISNYISTAYTQSWMHASMKTIRDGPEVNTPSAWMYARCPTRLDTSSRRWTLSLKANAEKARSKIGQAVGRGDGKGSSPVSRQQIMDVVKAFATEGSRKAAENICGVTSGWLSTGRGGESGYLSLHMMKWNPMLEQVAVVMSEQKRGKEKLVCVMAGRTPYICLFTAMGTYWTFAPQTSPGDGDVPYLIPGTPDTTQLSNILKSVKKQLPAESSSSAAAASASASSSSSAAADRTVNNALDGRGAARPAPKLRFEEYAVDGLPPDLSAASIRHGTLDLLTLDVAIQHVLMASGHASAERSALWEYISSSISRLQAASIVLHGFAPLPWGQNGRGSKPARFDALSEFTTEPEKIHEFVKRVLHLDFRFKVLRRGERLYKFTLACAAQLVMWYSEREKRDEFSSQLVFMVRCYVDVFAPRVTKRAGALVVGHRALVKWSKELHTDWVSRNVHMTARARGRSTGDESAEMVALVEAQEK